MDVTFTLTKKQKEFVDAKEDEVLYGGAAGGGKSFGQVIDAFLTAMRYPGIRQAMFRNSFPELSRSLILTALTHLPRDTFTYHSLSHTMRFTNGSTIEFGYLDSDSDVAKYQSAEYDVLRFDELTHFTDYQYTYMRSRLRGANRFPKQMKSSTNPGGRGHAWVKQLFIEGGGEDGLTRRFIPARVTDNRFLMEADPRYIERLQSLPAHEMRALLLGDWDVYEGQFFEEFRNDAAHYDDRRYTHVIRPFPVPRTWRVYRSFDFGYARPFSVGWWAVDYDGRLYRIGELYGCARDASGREKPNVGVKWTPEDIFRAIGEYEKENSDLRGRDILGVADPSIWDKSRGTSVAETGEALGIFFERGDNHRLPGWMQLRNRLRFDEEGLPMLQVFDTCKSFIRTVPTLIYSKEHPEDLDTDGEDHIADEVRYMCMLRPMPSEVPKIAKAASFDPLSAPKKAAYYALGR